MVKIISLFIIIGLNFSCLKPKLDKIQANKGVIDLRSWNFERDGILKLDGEWEFYHEEFLNPLEFKQRSATDFQDKKNIKNYIQVPGIWNDLQYKKEILNTKTNQKELLNLKVNGTTYGTYRLLLKLNPKDNYVIKVPDEGTAFTLYIDGELSIKNGEVGKSRETSLPSRENRIIKINTISETVEVLFHVSNFNYNVGGLWSSIFFGTYDDVYDYRDLHVFQDIFLSGLLAIMGFYHLGLYSVRTKERSASYFGLFCLFQSIRTLLINENALYTLIKFDFNLGVTIEYLTFYLGIPVFGNYLRNIFPIEDNKNVSSLLFGISYFFSAIVIFFPVIIFTKTLITMQIILVIAILNTITIIIKSILKKREGSIIFLFGFSIFSLIMINDVLHNRYFIETGYFTPIGFSIFIFTQSYLLSVRFSNALKREEEISMNLELKVLDRTLQLEEANKELVLLHKEAESLNILTKKINTKSNITETMKSISLYLQEEYGYTSVWLACHDKITNKLKTIYIETRDRSEEFSKFFNTLEISIEEESFLSKIYHSKEVLYIEVPVNESIESIDLKLFKFTDWKYFFILPLVIHNEVIGILTIHKQLGSGAINEREREQIQRFVEIIAGTIYSCNLYKETYEAKEIAELAIKDLNKSHAKIIQSEKLAALSQLVSSIAHEINTPMGAIKTSAELMNAVITNVLDSSLRLVHELELHEVNKIISVIKKSSSTSVILNTKEERALRKKITETLKEFDLPNKNLLSDLYVKLKYPIIEEEYFTLWTHPRASEIIKLIMDYVGLSHKSRVINKSVEKTSKITSALKRLSSGKNDDSKSKQNITEDIETVLLIYNNYIKQGIEVVRNFETIPLVECYPDSMHQVWTNIIFNSIQELNNKGTIIISILKSPLLETNTSTEGILVSIEDNGRGIPESIQEKLFQPFVTTKLEGEGSGLGLYFCKQIVDRHRGKIEIETEIGRTIVKVHLPLK
jgi:signal transduction histidine kinase